MTKANYDSCTFSGSETSKADSPLTVTFDTPGIQYWGCGVGAHCNSGQKINITVVAAEVPTTAAATTLAATTTFQVRLMDPKMCVQTVIDAIKSTLKEQ